MYNSEGVCTCGRDYTHCLSCGKKHPYPKKFLSEAMSAHLGQPVTVRRCQTCGQETHDLMECTAPKTFKPDPIRHGKDKNASIQSNLPQHRFVFGSPEYFEAFTERFNWLVANPRDRKNLSPMDAMRAEGWQTESDGPVRGEVCVDGSIASNKGVEESGPVELTLEQVIEKMKEEQK